MQKIIEKLRTQNVLTDVVELRVREFWQFCVEDIRDAQIRESVVQYLETASPWQFFVAPASPSGKHHPVWQNEPGGILRNTVECCLSVDKAMQKEWSLVEGLDTPKEPDRSIIFAATLLSDSFKGGDPWSPHTDYRHGKIAAEHWKKIALELGVPERSIALVYEATFWHLGRFTPGWTKEIDATLSLHTKITAALDAHYADKNLEKLFTPRSPLS